MKSKIDETLCVESVLFDKEEFIKKNNWSADTGLTFQVLHKLDVLNLMFSCKFDIF